MFSALLALLALPYADLSRTRGIQFKPLSKIVFFIFVANFIFLMVLGAKHVESPFIELGMICTTFYFLFFILLTPLISLIENTLLLTIIKIKNNTKQ
jgi:ubiquinol-cytochrome c reductase cytochrome b subunit